VPRLYGARYESLIRCRGEIEESERPGVIDNDGVETWHCHVSNSNPR